MIRGILYSLIAGMTWGLVFIAPQLLPDFSPLALSGARYLIYGSVSALFSFVHWRRIQTLLIRQHIAVSMGQALIANFIYFVLLAYGVQWAGTALTALIIGVVPLCVTLLGRKDVGSAPLKGLILPMLFIFCGIICINIDVFGQSAIENRGQNWHKLVGFLAAVGALACWAIYAVQNTRYLQRYPELGSGTWSCLFGLSSGIWAFFLGGMLFIFGDKSLFYKGNAANLDWGYFWGISATLAIFSSMIGNHFWNAASRVLPLTLSGQLIVFETLFALIYSYFLLQRWPGPLECGAIFLLMTGVLWAIRQHK
ncbi:MAG: DMT family transporter [Neisseriaceae bacterium]|nr:DMT family transporter [Neisseriaceae bacterium]